MKLPNKVYDVMKYLLAIFVPALIVFVSRLDVIWGFGADKIIETIAAFAVFLGAIFGISCYNYSKEQKARAEQNTYNEDAFLEMMDYEEEDYEDQEYSTEE